MSDSLRKLNAQSYLLLLVEKLKVSLYEHFISRGKRSQSLHLSNKRRDLRLRRVRVYQEPGCGSLWRSSAREINSIT